MNNIVEFPYTKNEGLRSAIKLLKGGSHDLAMIEFKKLIDQGCDEAYAFLGRLYEFGGDGVDRDYGKAKFYYEKSVETFGAVSAYIGLMRIYYHGLGVDRNYIKAMEYCLVISDQFNDPLANFYAGRMYMYGLGVDENLREAKSHFEKSWAAGYVFALGYLGAAEQRSGHWLKGWYYKLKAGYLAFTISRKNNDDPRVRYPDP